MAEKSKFQVPEEVQLYFKVGMLKTKCRCQDYNLSLPVCQFSSLQSASLSVCPSVRLSVSLSACQVLLFGLLFVCLSISQSISLSSVCPSVCLSVCLSVSQSVRQSVDQSARLSSLSVCLSVCLSVGLSFVGLSIFLPVRLPFSPPPSMSVCVSVCLCPSACLSQSFLLACLSVCLSVCLSFCWSIRLFDSSVSLFPFPFAHLPVWLSFFLSAWPSASPFPSILRFLFHILSIESRQVDVWPFYVWRCNRRTSSSLHGSWTLHAIWSPGKIQGKKNWKGVEIFSMLHYFLSFKRLRQGLICSSRKA